MTVKQGRLVILAAGVGSRMKKPAEGTKIDDLRLVREADEKPKAMIGVGKESRPFLDYLLHNAQEAGYQDVVLVVSDKDEYIRPYYSSDKPGIGGTRDLSISFAEQRIPEGRGKPLGTADALLQALVLRKDWAGQKFTVCNSDNLYSVNALRLLRETPNDNALIAYDRTALEFAEERIKKFAVLMNDDAGYLRRIIEKPSDKEVAQAKDSSGKVRVSMNIFALSYSQILPVLEEVPLNPDRDEKELPQAVSMLVSVHRREVMTYPLSEHVPDLTSKDDITRVQSEIGTISI